MKPNTHLHYSMTPPLRVWLLSLLFLSSFIPHPSSFASESPLVIPFQGQITNQQNALVPTGQYSIIFNLYDVAVGGQPLWTERHSKVGVVNGMVNVFLGSITSLAAVDFSQTRYLGITVDVDDKPTTADPEMVPRQMIIPAFYAKKAENSTKLAGNDWSSILTGGSNDPSTGTIRGDKIATESITSSQLAAASITTSHIQEGAITIGDLSPSLAADLVPPGTIIAYMGTTAPTGWMFCYGGNVSRATYPRLFAAIGTSCGSGDGTTTFGIPDLRGMFLRGMDYNNTGADPDRAGRTAMASGGNTGNAVGTKQGHQVTAHNHEVRAKQDAGSIGGNIPIAGGTVTWSFHSAGNLGAGSSDGVTKETGGLETRPVNVSVNYIIKY